MCFSAGHVPAAWLSDTDLTDPGQFIVCKTVDQIETGAKIGYYLVRAFKILKSLPVPPP